MSINELIAATKATKVTQAQVDKLREKLKKKENEGNVNASASKAFLARTYSL